MATELQVKRPKNLCPIFQDVNVAARIQALADPGGIYISRSAADQVRDKVPIKIETRGEQSVKNIARPIEVFCIIAEDLDATAKAMHKSESVVQTPIVADKPAIAVLPFVNMSGEPQQEFFADGITEDCIIAEDLDATAKAMHKSESVVQTPIRDL
jgi:adenylate cyclase